MAAIQKKTGFPFGQTAEEVSRRQKASGNPILLQPFLSEFRPYKGGNNTLWDLNQIRNANTHRFIVRTTIAAHPILSFRKAAISGPSIFENKWNPEAKELEYMRVGIGSELEYRSRFAVNVTFCGIEAVAGKAVIPTLEAMADEVARVVAAIELECYRLRPSV